MSITLDGTAGISSTGGIDAADLTGALPALDGAALTALTSANLTGALPAISGSNLTGIDYPVKAWVSFNGTGVVAIRASLNVSSITDNGVGNYTVNFSTAMADTDYVVLGNAQSNTPVISVNPKSTVRTVNAIAVGVGYTDTAPSFRVADTDYVSVTIIR